MAEIFKLAFETRTKKPMWLNTRWCLATSVYFLTSPLGLPGCYLSSRPKTMARKGLLTLSPTLALYGIRLIKQGRRGRNRRLRRQLVRFVTRSVCCSVWLSPMLSARTSQGLQPLNETPSPFGSQSGVTDSLHPKPEGVGVGRRL